MIKRPFCGMAAGFLFGILAAAHAGPWALFSVPVFWGMTGVCIVLCRRKAEDGNVLRARLLPRFFLILAMFFLGWCRYRGEERFCGRYLAYLEDGSLVCVQGELDRKELRGRQYIYQLSSCVMGRRSDGGGIRNMVRCSPILVYSDSDIGSIGEILVLEGKMKIWESARNEGNFDARAYYRARNVAFGLNEVTVKSRHGKENGWREGLWKLGLRIRDVYLSVMGEKAGGILAAIALGDKSLLDRQMKECYQAAGLSHILAVSGLHISVVGMTVYGLFRRAAFGYPCAGLVAAGVMYVYALLTGMGISVQRAFGMFLLFLLAQALGRGYDSLNALGALAFVLLCRNPFLLWDAGFWFSFVAVTGIVSGRGIGGEVRRVGGKLRQTLFSGIAVQLATLPLVAWYNSEVPIYAFFANLLVLPMMGVISGCGIVGGFTGLFSLPLSSVILFLCRLLLELSSAVCQVCAGLPGAGWIVGRPEPGSMILYYTGLVAAAAYRRHRSHSAGKSVGAWYVAACVFLLSVLLFPRHKGFELDVLDVGQGDACFLRTRAGHTVFVDGGSSDVSSVGTYRILPFLKAKGARRIDYWFVSHLDADHISGLSEILSSGYRVRCLVFSREICREEKLEELSLAAEACGTEVLFLGAGDLLHLGEAQIRVLYPAAKDSGTDRNAGSMVFLYEEETFAGIFTGDIGRREERRLLEMAGPDLAGKIDFYKAAHHGSDGSSSAELLNAIRPSVSVISCSRGNRYGHPGREAMRHMKEAQSSVYLTMEGGRIRIRMKRGRLIVDQYCVDF